MPSVDTFGLRKRFGSSLQRTDELITQALTKKNALTEATSKRAAATDIGVARIGATSRLRQTGMETKSAQSLEELQQGALTARQRITQAGDLALQQLQGKQALQRQRASDSAALTRVKEAGTQTRQSQRERLKLDAKLKEDFFTKYYGGVPQDPYIYGGGESALEIPDIEQYLNY